MRVLAIARWALDRSDPKDWLAPFRATGDDTGSADALVALNDGPFKHHLDRYKYASRYENEDPMHHRAEGVAILEDYAKRLSGGRFLAGDSFTFLDAAIAPFVRQFRIADKDWFDASAPEPVRDWLSRFLDRYDFRTVMKKYRLWKPGDDPVIFPPE